MTDLLHSESIQATVAGSERYERFASCIGRYRESENGTAWQNGLDLHGGSLDPNPVFVLNHDRGRNQESMTNNLIRRSDGRDEYLWLALSSTAGRVNCRNSRSWKGRAIV